MQTVLKLIVLFFALIILIVGPKIGKKKMKSSL